MEKIKGTIGPIRGAAKLVKDSGKKDLIVVEVGVADGRNSVSMLRNMPIKRLYLVDSYPNYLDGPFIRAGIRQENYYMAMFNNLEPFLERVVFITRDSAYSSKLFIKDTFDFVYIDGFHRYSQVKKDIEAWWPLVKEGGILGGHDLGHVDFPGVIKAVEGFCKKIGKEVKSGRGSDWIIEK